MDFMVTLKRFLQSRLLLLFLFGVFGCENIKQKSSGWPDITYETKPWTRWWWHGSAVTKEGITSELEMLSAAGIGGVEITPIYGVYGYEDKFIQFLSDEWIELLIHTLQEAQRLGLGVDMATGTGWPFGGPWVSDEDACKNFQIRMYEINSEASLPKRIEYVQQPYLRAVGFNVPHAKSTPVDIDAIKQPVTANANLQHLAIDQIQFERKLPIVAVMAFGEDNTPIDITSEVSATGELKWKYPGGRWKLYAVFQGWHGKLVERAAPGGEGNVIDHFSVQALNRYLSRFDSAFQRHNIKSLRAFFNDSYEVDDARGTANWTPQFLDEFRKRRGYDLLHYLPHLSEKDTTEKAGRLRCDYRETIGELLLNNFTKQWKQWAHLKEALVRNQAHGSPANILDLYSEVDIPEIEGTEPLRIKMASSAANVSGKLLVSAEAATWLNEHFESNLGDVKEALDRFMLNGVNHLVYHGTSYSPADEPWPGWLFYAAVHFNPRNPQWKDLSTLNQYVARCQSFLQNTMADNDVLLYYPFYDPLSAPGREMLEHFDGIGKQFEGSSFARCADSLLQKGYSFDYISDSQIKQLVYQNQHLVTKGNAKYSVIVIPQCKYMPLATLKALLHLAEQGAAVVFYDGLPQNAPGLGSMGDYELEFLSLLKKIRKQATDSSNTKRLIIGEDIDQLLKNLSITRETLPDQGIQFIRKHDNANNTIYFIKNTRSVAFRGWMQMNRIESEVEIFNPVTGKFGKGITKQGEAKDNLIFIRLEPSETLIIRSLRKEADLEEYVFFNDTENVMKLSSPWHLTFVSGGPALPPPLEMDSSKDWTTLGQAQSVFSGTAIYTTTFNAPVDKKRYWKLDLGEVHESAEISINGVYIGTLIQRPFTLIVGPDILREKNELKVVVSNSMANRIIDMNKRKLPWKKFYNINFAARKPENRVNGVFDASNWLPKKSGLLGPVRLVEVTPLSYD